MTLPAARLGDQTVHGGVIAVGCPTVLIGGKPAARIGDQHVCPMVTGVVPHVGGPLALGAFTVLVGGPPQSRQTDMAICVGPPDMVAIGMPTVLVGMAGAPGAMGMAGAVMGGLFAGLMNWMSDGPKAVLEGGQVVTQYNDGITIEGTPEFQATVVRDLRQIESTPTGEALIASIDGSGRNVRIQETAGGNACGYTSPADRFYGADGSPGAGTDARVHYNPNRERIGPEPWATRPPAIGLAHELVHADQAAHGTQRTGMDQNDAKPDPANPGAMDQEKVRELEAAGIAPHDGREHNENKIRSEWDPPQPQRNYY